MANIHQVSVFQRVRSPSPFSRTHGPVFDSIEIQGTLKECSSFFPTYVKVMENGVPVNKISINWKPQLIIDHPQHHHTATTITAIKCGKAYYREGMKSWKRSKDYASNFRRDRNTLSTSVSRLLSPNGMKFWKCWALFGRNLKQKSSVMFSQIADISWGIW